MKYITIVRVLRYIKNVKILTFFGMWCLFEGECYDGSMLLSGALRMKLEFEVFHLKPNIRNY
jgi:hypothetical protein